MRSANCCLAECRRTSDIRQPNPVTMLKNISIVKPFILHEFQVYHTDQESAFQHGFNSKGFENWQHQFEK